MQENYLNACLMVLPFVIDGAELLAGVMLGASATGATKARAIEGVSEEPAPDAGYSHRDDYPAIRNGTMGASGGTSEQLLSEIRQKGL